MGRNIVIVEDEILVGMMLKKMIEEQGVEVAEIVTTGEAAIVAATARNPDLMLMDVSLPGGMDGITAAAKIRESSCVPIIFFTGNCWSDEIIRRCNEVKPVAILEKMGSFSAILDTIKRTLIP